MKGIMQDEVRLRNDKSGATIPNLINRILIDQKSFTDIIEEGRVMNRFHYVDYEKLHSMIEQLKQKHNKSRLDFDPNAFLSPISVLILQKWQREG
ncbi:MAG: hypothetical protein ACWGNV_15555, partial [Bacteroidales bacterium]